jgi:outer membrane protein TolC
MSVRTTCTILGAVAAAVLSVGCGPLAGESELAGRLYDEGKRYRVTAAGKDELPKLDEKSGLPELLAYAALRSPGLEAAFLEWRAALERVPVAGALPDPRLAFGWYILEVETRVGPQRAKLGLVQPVPGPGKLAAKSEVALREAEAAEARYDAAKLDLFNRVEGAYWEHWYLAKATVIADENLQLLARLEAVVRRKYTTGAAESSALTRIQVELGKLEDRLTELRDLRAPSAARLNAALGRGSGARLPWPPPEPVARAGEMPAFDALDERMRSRSPELAKASLAVSKAEAVVTLAERSGRPDFAFGLDYVFTGDAPTGVPDSGADALMIGVSTSLPLARGKYRAAREAAETARDAAAKVSEQTTHDLESELRMALFGYRDASRKIDLYRTALVPKARQALEVVLGSFEADRSTYLDLIDAQRTLLEFDLSLARARADRGKSLSRLNALVGEDVLGAAKQPKPATAPSKGKAP